MINRFSKYQIATCIAVLFHIIGITGILFFNKDFFIRSTSFNLLLMFALLVWTQEEKNKYFLLFLATCFITGIGAEIIGVNTSLLFGDYQYGTVLGPGILNVPLIIGINWFIIIFCCGISVNTLVKKISNSSATIGGNTPKTMKMLSIVVDGATLAVLFDWLMEPVAIQLEYWHWNGSGEVPFFNYICWFIISILLLVVFHLCKFAKQNKFAVNLLLIQVLFFLLLRTFLN